MRARKRQSGQAMLESALVLLIFLVVLIGIFDMGQFLYFHQSLTERARAAARYGAVNTYSSPGLAIQNVAIYNDPNGAGGGATAVLPYLNTVADTNGYVSATLLGAVGTDDARIVVTIQNYPYRFLSPYMSKATWLRTIIAAEPYEILP
jgi:Flp pilus assembly protein TadG